MWLNLLNLNIYTLQIPMTGIYRILWLLKLQSNWLLQNNILFKATHSYKYIYGPLALSTHRLTSQLRNSLRFGIKAKKLIAIQKHNLL